MYFMWYQLYIFNPKSHLASTLPPLILISMIDTFSTSSDNDILSTTGQLLVAVPSKFYHIIVINNV